MGSTTEVRPARRGQSNADEDPEASSSPISTGSERRGDIGGLDGRAERPPVRRSRPRLLAASVVVAAPGWVGWLLHGHRAGLASPVRTTLILVVNFVVTRLTPTRKGRAVRAFQKYVLNPPVRILVYLGLLPLGYALLETTGRVSGKPRRTPVGNGLMGDSFWVVAEHGRSAHYVRNLEANPRVRVRVRSDLRPVWRAGVAHILDGDDAHARQHYFSRWHPLRAWNAAFVRVLGSELLTIRIDLEPRSR